MVAGSSAWTPSGGRTGGKDERRGEEKIQEMEEIPATWNVGFADT